MSHYGILLPSFWDGETGPAIARAGGSDAQLVALYLMSNTHANMIGLYRAKLDIIRVQIGSLSAKALERGLAACREADFADYDMETEHVWVHEMAKFRLGLHKKPIDRKDNRATAAQRLYEKLTPNPFLGPFFKRYRRDLHIPKARGYKGPAKLLGSPLPSPFEAPSKPVTDNSKQDQEDQEQDQNLPACAGNLAGGR